MVSFEYDFGLSTLGLLAPDGVSMDSRRITAVSYTHLTLPTSDRVDLGGRRIIKKKEKKNTKKKSKKTKKDYSNNT